ncbi:MAG TPA: class I SAM-dependent methyltransferase [Chitinophagaceae bacterium]|nr:class I SAM-dependent methyltransferase [Chitinophagaceae bacterium]
MKTIAHGQPWFASWFDTNYYHQLYRHRDDKEAENFIDMLLNEIRPGKDSVMLDLGCGSGRHSKYLASKGYKVFGLDLAASSIREAKKSANESLHFFKWDMRKPFGKKNFDLVFSFFTSFGYFNSQQENNKVIGNMATALKDGGTILIDYLNIGYAENHLVAVEEMEIDGVRYHINRWSDDRFIYKRIAIMDRRQVVSKAYTEQVARFTLGDFDQMFHENGLQCESVYGDYRLNDYDAQSSERMILTATKNK